MALTSKDSDNQALRETNLKGRMAESLVHDLLVESGNEVYRIGFESVLPGLTRLNAAFKRNAKVGEKVRSIPDFFVLTKGGDPYLVEVKFRWNPQGHETDILRMQRIAHHWEEAIVVFVNCAKKPYFRYVAAPFFNKKSEIEFKPFELFMPLGVSENLLEKYDALVEKYLKPTLKTPLPKDSSVLDHPFQYMKPQR